jgi:hypothetical protein
MYGKGSCMTLRSSAVSAPLLRAVLLVGRSITAISQLSRCTGGALFALLVFAIQIQIAHAQSSGQGYSPLIVTPPVVDSIDETNVSMLSGKAQFTIPALKLGDASFAPYSYNGKVDG